MVPIISHATVFSKVILQADAFCAWFDFGRGDGVYTCLRPNTRQIMLFHPAGKSIWAQEY
jgi:hypothetical protein